VFLANPSLPPSNGNFCSSENSTLLPRRAASRLGKRLTAATLQNEETPLLIHGVKRLLQVDENPIEGGLLNVGKLLSQLCLNHRDACPLPV
jgi:hypothetical protein